MLDNISLLISSFNSIYTELFLIICATSLLLYSVIFEKRNTDTLVITRNVNTLAILVLVFSIIITVTYPYDDTVTFNGMFISDIFIRFVKVVVISASIAVLILSSDYVRYKNIYSYEYVILVLFSISGMLLLVSSHDMLSIYVSIELYSLCFYVLASIKRNSEYSTEAGFKYFILGVFASGFLLLGFSILYGITGVTNLEQFEKIVTGMALNPTTSTAIFISILLILIAFLFKLGIAPFHMWLPDVYEGSPTNITAFFAIVPKIVIFSVIIRIYLFSFYEYLSDIQNVLIICSIASMIFASLTALYQTKIKRLLAYSAIGHGGYMIIGLIAGTFDGIQSILIYMLIYIVTSVLTFSIVLSTAKYTTGIQVRYISELIALSKANPVVAISLSLALFSMAGVPPMAGFFGKLYIFSSAINTSMYLVAIVGVLASVIGAVYYIYLIKTMYFDVGDVWTLIRPMNYSIAILMAVSVLFILFFFTYPALLFNITHEAILFFER